MTSPITEFYRNKNIFITGGTGFLGIALIDKILRSLPDVSVFFVFYFSFLRHPFILQVENVYLLMRPKKGKSIEERLQDLTKNEVNYQNLYCD